MAKNIVTEKIEELPIAKIISSKLNPRQVFDEAKLQELADSIKEKGLQQAITVRPSLETEGNFEVVIGERRFRACKLLKMETIKAVVRTIDDGEARTIMLIENCQREDLTELELGMMFRELHETLKIPIVEIARRIGKSTMYVSEKYTLVKKLAPMVQQMMIPTVDEPLKKLDYAIAVKIAELPHSEQIKLAEKVIDYGLTQENVVEKIHEAEELEATLDRLPNDNFKKKLEEEYLPKKFDSILPELKQKIIEEKGLVIETPLYPREINPLITRLLNMTQKYPELTAILEWNGNASGIAKMLVDLKKLCKEDNKKHILFIAKV